MEKSRVVAAYLLRAASQCSTLRPATLLEIAAFAVGTKPALRFVVSNTDAQTLVDCSAALGLVSETAQTFVEPKANGWSELVCRPTSVSQTLVVITKDSRAGNLLQAEVSDPLDAGILLGYPDCCVRSLDRLSAAAEQWALHLLDGAVSPINARVNRFAAEWGGVGLIGELFPCSLTCQAAAAYAQSLYDAALALGLSKLAETAKSDALSPVKVSSSGRISQSALSGSVEFFW